MTSSTSSLKPLANQDPKPLVALKLRREGPEDPEDADNGERPLSWSLSLSRREELLRLRPMPPLVLLLRKETPPRPLSRSLPLLLPALPSLLPLPPAPAAALLLLERRPAARLRLRSSAADMFALSTGISSLSPSRAVCIALRMRVRRVSASMNGRKPMAIMYAKMDVTTRYWPIFRSMLNCENRIGTPQKQVRATVHI